MWTTDELGLATWTAGLSAWQFDVRGAEFGIGLRSESHSSSSPSASVADRYLAIEPVDGNPLPRANEQYVRGDRYFINYPQGDGRYAIRLALRPIESHGDLLVIEVTVSIQTDLLDSHPMLDLVASGIHVHPFEQSVEQDDMREGVRQPGGGSPPISVARGPVAVTAVLLGPHDSPFTSDQSSDGRLSLRLFGDFLEKGVIRTATPWIVVDRMGQVDLQSRLPGWLQQLCQSPLPLSS